MSLFYGVMGDVASNSSSCCFVLFFAFCQVNQYVQGDLSIRLSGLPTF